MPPLKISQFGSATLPLSDNDLFTLVAVTGGNANKNITFADLKTQINSGVIGSMDYNIGGIELAPGVNAVGIISEIDGIRASISILDGGDTLLPVIGYYDSNVKSAMNFGDQGIDISVETTTPGTFVKIEMSTLGDIKIIGTANETFYTNPDANTLSFFGATPTTKKTFTEDFTTDPEAAFAELRQFFIDFGFAA